jgi:hypothetical protein
MSLRKQGSQGQAFGRLADLGRRIGDHAGQDEAHADGEQGHDHENIGEQRHALVVPVRDGVDREQIGDAVEHQNGHHGAGELDVERLGHGAENCGEQPDAGGDHTKHDGAARRAIGTLGVG